jgi:hypothetical protein
VALYLTLTPSVLTCMLMTPTPVTNYVELTSVTDVTALKSVLAITINVLVVDSIRVTIVSRQWDT